MTYTVLARRYRSDAFGKVIGQKPIADTLRSAIAAGRVAHAYLFCGTRGVGKTSMARLFARALNAPDTIDDATKPPDGEYPPLEVQQRMAAAIMRGEDLNVIEIDGASNNKVEDARDLISNAGLSPTDAARYKIYIIDEVHMLSGAAFNALLKTMEEPPAHVKFILCTTEPHKLPATILSRCQRFDFRNIATRAIAGHLTNVLASEKIQADDQVVWQIAQLGNGSMRDALSLLDRVIATGEQPVTLAVLEQMLGLPPQALMVDLIDALAEGDVAVVLEKAASLLDGGIAQDQLIDVLVERLRQLMLLQACGPESELVELADDARQAAMNQARRFDVAGLVHMIALCDSLQRTGKNSANPRALLEATLVRLALAEKMADVTAVLTGQAPAAGASNADSKKKVLAPPAQSRAVERQAPPPPPAPAPPEATLPRSAPPQTAEQLWRQILHRIGQVPSLGWARNMQVDTFDRDQVCMSPRAGFRHLVSFAQAERPRQQLANLLREVLDRPVQLRIAANLGDVAPEAPEPSTTGNGTARHEQAMQLPLVRQVLENFDARVIQTFDEKQTVAPPPDEQPIELLEIDESAFQEEDEDV